MFWLIGIRTRPHSTRFWKGSLGSKGEFGQRRITSRTKTLVICNIRGTRFMARTLCEEGGCHDLDSVRRDVGRHRLAAVFNWRIA